MSVSTETTLFQALRTDPADQATRQVYADWLEQHGYATRASFLRLDAIESPDDDELAAIAAPADAGWRSVVSRPPIAKCVTFSVGCPKRWDALAPTPTDGVRHCGTCDRPVYFCATLEDAHRHGSRRECVAVDAALTREPALAAYEDSNPDNMWMGEVAVDPGPPIDDEPVVTATVEPIIPQPASSGFLARLRDKVRGR